MEVDCNVLKYVCVLPSLCKVLVETAVFSFVSSTAFLVLQVML